MEIEIKIGREVEGPHVYLIPSTYKKTSRHHATLHWCNGTATLEDRSTNGTFVNGRRITQATIMEGDTLWLGGNGMYEQGYQVDMRKLFSICREAESSQHNDYSRPAMGGNYPYPKAESAPYSQPTSGATYPGATYPSAYSSNDYSRDFDHLKQTHIDYHEALSKLKKKTNMKMQLPRVLLSLIPIVVVAIILLIFREKLGMMSMVVMSVVSVLGSLIGVLTMGRSSSKQEKLAEAILDLQLKYQKDYKCPKCGKEYSLDLHWKKLAADGKCPYGCGAQFTK